jgi:hypothetical protein
MHQLPQTDLETDALASPVSIGPSHIYILTAIGAARCTLLLFLVAATLVTATAAAAAANTAAAASISAACHQLSHEVGHTLGLVHKGFNTTGGHQEYYK